MTDQATIIIDSNEYKLPLITGSEGERAIDISRLRSKTGVITLDNGLGNTGSCQSAITYIDGEKGILRYRGIPIESFTHAPNFIEVAWLLIFGSIPDKAAYQQFSNTLTQNANIDEDMKHHFAGFPRNAPPMAVLSAMISSLSCFHPEFIELENKDEFEQAAARLISKIRTLAAYAYRRSMGLSYIYPDPSLPYAPNFLHMMFSQPYQRYECSDEIRQMMNLLFILHADHEQNCSTSTVRMVGSGKANLFASCAAGVSALWGDLHGGANMRVIEMLDRIRRHNLTPEAFLQMVKEKRNNIRLMGFGHRVYKNFDPRAQVLRNVSQSFLQKMGVDDPLLEIALKLEAIALQDPYFIERKLYPNVDFYSGIILRAIGIPTNMFTVLFAIGRLPGWIAHWYEQTTNPDGRISRPRQIYTGPQLCQYQPVDYQ
jgi:citrate synthase